MVRAAFEGEEAGPVGAGIAFRMRVCAADVAAHAGDADTTRTRPLMRLASVCSSTSMRLQCWHKSCERIDVRVRANSVKVYTCMLIHVSAWCVLVWVCGCVRMCCCVC
jgi:hypothetical protein